MISPEEPSSYEHSFDLRELMAGSVAATLEAYSRTGEVRSLESEMTGLNGLELLRNSLRVSPQEDLVADAQAVLHSASPRDEHIKRALSYVFLSKTIGPDEKRELCQVWVRSISSGSNRVCPKGVAGHYATSVAGELADAMPERRDIRDMEKVLDSEFGHLRQALGWTSVIGAGIAGAVWYAAKKLRSR